jgi:hypothetical protein
VAHKSDATSWRFGLESIRCDRLGELGLDLSEVSRGDGRPLSASWYRVKGGPLNMALVKVFPGEGPGLCNVMPGSAAYWAERGESPEKRD